MALSNVVPAIDAHPAASVADVIALMGAMDASLAATDGVSWFNKLYKKVTERVAVALGEGTFENAAFVDRLDVVFANLYFKALQAFLRAPDSVPRAWSPLFASNEEQGIAPIQFALAGMNAHINRDLMVALVSVFEETGMAPRRDSPERRDYDRLNPILQEVETTVRAWFLEGFMKEFDGVFEKIDTIIANWSLVEARDAAWNHAETLWRIRQIDFIEDAYVESVDGLVGFAGRGLLLKPIHLASL